MSTDSKPPSRTVICSQGNIRLHATGPGLFRLRDGNIGLPTFGLARWEENNILPALKAPKWVLSHDLAVTKIKAMITLWPTASRLQPSWSAFKLWSRPTQSGVCKVYFRRHKSCADLHSSKFGNIIQPDSDPVHKRNSQPSVSLAIRFKCVAPWKFKQTPFYILICDSFFLSSIRWAVAMSCDQKKTIN